MRRNVLIRFVFLSSLPPSRLKPYQHEIPAHTLSLDEAEIKHVNERGGAPPAASRHGSDRLRCVHGLFSSITSYTRAVVDRFMRQKFVP